ncbi:hypothetical protein ACLOJK_021116 [Asimina triloba]
MEGGPPPVAAKKRLWHIVRVLFYMLRRSIAKNKLMVDLHLMMKRGTVAGKKAIGHLMFHHHQAVHVSYYVPREYEFSCSNTPTPSYNPFHVSSSSSSSKRKNHHQHHHHGYFSSCIQPTHTEEDNMVAAQKALEMLSFEAPGGVSPFLPEFGKSPAVRQLRITDSPFPIRDSGDGQVDQEAEEFINRFYQQLRQQSRQVEMDARYREMILAGC